MQSKKTLRERVLSAVLSAAMLFGMMPTTVYAAESAACSHLKEDGTYSCALAVATAGNADELICAHDDECGYVAAEESNEAEIAAYDNVVKLFTALPAADTLTEENRDAFIAQLTEAMDAFEALSTEQQDKFLEQQAELYKAAMALNDAITGSSPVTMEIAPRLTSLDLTATSVTYQAADSTTKTADPTTASITDTNEGWAWDIGTKTLTLSGANITGEAVTTGELYLRFSVVYGVKLPKDAIIELTAGTVSTIVSGEYDSKDGGFRRATNAGIFGCYNLTIQGQGKLIATSGKTKRDANGSDSAGIFVFDIDDSSSKTLLTVNGGIIEANGGYAECKNFDAKSFGIKSDNINITGGNVTAKAGMANGPYVPQTMSGINCESEGIRADEQLDVTGANTVVTAESGVFSDSNPNLENIYFCGIRARNMIITDAVVKATANDIIIPPENTVLNIALSRGISFSGNTEFSNAQITAIGGNVTSTLNADVESIGMELNGYGGQLIVSGTSILNLTAGNTTAANKSSFSSGFKSRGNTIIKDSAQIFAQSGQAIGKEALSIGLNCYQNNLLTQVKGSAKINAIGLQANSLTDQAQSFGIRVGKFEVDENAEITGTGAEAKSTSGDAFSAGLFFENDTLISSGKINATGNTATAGSGKSAISAGIHGIDYQAKEFKIKGGEITAEGLTTAICAIKESSPYDPTDIAGGLILDTSIGIHEPVGGVVADAEIKLDEYESPYYYQHIVNKDKTLAKKAVIKLTTQPYIKVGEQTGEVSYATQSSATFNITGTNFGKDNNPAFAPQIKWITEKHDGITASISNNVLTLSNSATVNAGEYKFKVVSPKTDGGSYESPEITYTINKIAYTSTLPQIEASVPTGKTPSASGVILLSSFMSELPLGAKFGKINTYPNTVISSAKISDDGQSLYWTAKDNLSDIDLTEAVSVTIQSTNYNDIPLTLNFKSVSKADVDVDLSGVSISGVNDQNIKPYDGATKITGKPVAKKDGSALATQPTFSYIYMQKSDRNYYYFIQAETAPNDVGDYKLVVVADNDQYYGSSEIEFSITQKNITVTDGTLKISKPYDGKTDAGTVTGKLGLNGIVASDADKISVEINSVGAYADANYGKNKSVELKVFLMGIAQYNYNLASSSYTFTKAEIAKPAYTGPAASAPSAEPVSKTDTEITLMAVTPPEGEKVEYAISASSTPPTDDSAWQDSTTFVKLSSNTAYFFFARVKESDTHAAGGVSAGTAIATSSGSTATPEYTGAQAFAPRASTAIKTTNSVTLDAQIIDGETVEYGISDASNGTITWQDSTAFTNLDSNKTYYFFARVKTNASHLAGVASAGTAIKTKPAPTNVSGIITDSSSNPVNGASVELKQGNTVIKATITSTDGSYIVTDVPAGVYNLVVTRTVGSSKIVITEIVSVQGTPITGKSISFLDGNKNTVVETAPNTPKVAVGGMNNLLSPANIDKTLTASEKNAVDANGSVELKFAADVKAVTDVKGDIDKINNLATGKKIGMHIDLSVTKTVKSSTGEILTNGAKISTLSGIIEVYLPIPAKLQDQPNLSLYRVHNGEAQAMSKTPDANGEYYVISEDCSYITLYVKNFSTYALAHTAMTVTMTDGGAGASGAGNYSVGDIVTINAGTKSGYIFSGWTVTSGAATLANASNISTTFVMPSENVTVKANWTYDANASGAYFYITATAGPGGSISTPEKVKVRIGESAGFTIIPNKGYQIADVLVNGKSIGAKNYYAFTNVLSNQTIHATFKKSGHSNPQTGVILP